MNELLDGLLMEEWANQCLPRSEERVPPLEQMDLVDKAVLWLVEGVDRYNEPLIGDPEEIDVRWVWGRTQALSPTGMPIGIDAQAVSDRPIPVGSLMQLIELKHLPPGTGTNDEDLHDRMEVVTTKEGKDLKGRHTRYELGLVWFKSTLPENA